MSDFDPSLAVEESAEPPSRRRRKSQRQTRGRSIYDWVVISLLLLVPTLGIIVFGGSRMWSFGPLIMITFLAALLFFGRALFSEEHHLLRFPPGFIFFSLFFLYAFVAIFLSTVPYESKVEWMKIGSYLMAFWLWTMVSFPYKRWRFLLGWTLLLISLICLYALILHGKELRTVLNLTRPEDYGMRASGTYICPNHFAHLIEIGLCMAVALLFMPASGAVLRIISVYFTLVSLPVLFLTHSRSGWLGAITGVTLTGLILAWNKGRKFFFTMALSIPAVLFIFGAVLWNYSPDFQERILSAAPDHPMSTGRIRLQIWQDVLPMIEKHPAIGVGPGCFRWHYGQYQGFKRHLWARYVHNEYIHLMVDYGLIGFGLFALFWLAILWWYSRRLKDASKERDFYLIAGLLGGLAASMVHALFDYNFHLFANNHVLAMFGGITAAGLYTSGTLPTRKAGAGVRIGIAATACLLGVFIIGLTLKAFLADGYFRLGEKHMYKGRKAYDKAQALFEKSIRSDEKFWEPHIGIAKIIRGKNVWQLNRQVRVDEALRAIVSFEKALQFNPYDAEIMFGIGKAYLDAGEPEKSLVWLKKAVDYDPQNQAYLNHYALRLSEAGELEKALEVFKRSNAVLSSDEMSRINIKMLQERMAKAKKSPTSPPGVPPPGSL